MTRTIKKMGWSDKISGLLIKHRTLLFFLCWAMVFAFSSQLYKTQFVSNVYTLVDNDGAVFHDTERLQSQYPESVVKLLLLLDFERSTLALPEKLNLIHQVNRRLLESSFFSSALSVLDAKNIIRQDGGIFVEDYFHHYEKLDIADVETRFASLDKSPIFGNQLVSNDRTLYSILVQPRADTPEPDDADLRAFFASLEHDIKQQDPNTELLVLGKKPLQWAMADASLNSLSVLYPIIFLIGNLIVLWYGRSFMLMFGGFGVVVASVLVTLGAAAMSGVVLNDTSALSLVLVFTVAMADMLHIVTSLRQHVEQANSSQERLEALRCAFRDNLQPIFLTTVTTALGFLCLNTCASPALKDLGNLAALGVLVAFVATLMMLPFLMAIVPFGKRFKEQPLRPLMALIARQVTQHPKRYIVVFSVVIIICVPLILLNAFKDNPVRYFPESSPFRQAVTLVGDKLSGSQEISVSVSPPENTNVFDANFINKIKAFEAWVLTQPNVKFVTGYAGLAAYLDTLLGGGSVNDNAATSSSASDADQFNARLENIEEYLMLLELNDADPASGRLLSIDRDAVRISVRTQPVDSASLLVLEAAIRDWFVHHYSKAGVVTGGDDLLFAHTGSDVVEGMAWGSLLALVLISIGIGVGLWSFKLCLLSLIPNVVPSAIVYGVWGALSGEVNMVVAVTFSISLGIVVDDSVHLLTRFERYRRLGETPSDAVRKTLVEVGPTLTITTLVISAGLTVLCLSDFGVHSMMGAITAPIVALALILDFYLLSALYIVLHRPKQLKETSQGSELAGVPLVSRR